MSKKSNITAGIEVATAGEEKKIRVGRGERSSDLMVGAGEALVDDLALERV